MVNNSIVLRCDKNLRDKILNQIIAKELRRGKRISIEKATRVLADKLEGRMEELLEDKFIKF